ncbi:MAG: NAD(P)H-dependent oxidoreductase [Alphaproteobacteria bacterium]|nr:NAD(P)H-dependent oxidoreductase [Alphaproteobacteria bacterium]
MNILIINGHQKTPFASGKLNRTLVDEMKKFFGRKKSNTVKTTIVARGYNPELECKKFKWADVIIYQFPIYWFSVPALLQQYMQDVYSYGSFYKTDGKPYGHGGLLQGKKYMFSSTWNSPAEAFGHDFWQGVPGPDFALVHLHKAQQFIGLSALPCFSCHNVVKDPQVKEYIASLKKHLRTVFGK